MAGDKCCREVRRRPGSWSIGRQLVGDFAGAFFSWGGGHSHTEEVFTGEWEVRKWTRTTYGFVFIKPGFEGK